MNGFSPAQQQFFDYLKANNPSLYSVAMNAAKRATAAQGLSGMGDIDWSGIFSKVTDAVTKAAPAVLQYKQERDLMKVQVERAKADLPPVDAAAYRVRSGQMSTGPNSRGGARGQIPQDVYTPAFETGANAKKMALYIGGAALLGLVALFALRKR